MYSKLWAAVSFPTSSTAGIMAHLLFLSLTGLRLANQRTSVSSTLGLHRLISCAIQSSLSGGHMLYGINLRRCCVFCQCYGQYVSYPSNNFLAFSLIISQCLLISALYCVSADIKSTTCKSILKIMYGRQMIDSRRSDTPPPLHGLPSCNLRSGDRLLYAQFICLLSFELGMSDE